MNKLTFWTKNITIFSPKFYSDIFLKVKFYGFGF